VWQHDGSHAGNLVETLHPSVRHYSEILPGTHIADRYRILYLLGHGGMGEVYRGHDLEVDQAVALKFLPMDVGGDANRLDRFRAEVRISRKVTHPNVCRVYDIGEFDGRHFLSMEYIDGDDLQRLLRRIGRLPGEKVVDLAMQLLDGLACAHMQGVIHRDLKPANIMVDGRGLARVTAFGLAVTATGLTYGDFSGTPAYMSPEQKLQGIATAAGDLYSLALVLFEAVTGRVASRYLESIGVRSEDGQVAHALLDFAGDRLTRPLRDLVRQCLQPSPEDRPASSRELAEEFARASREDLKVHAFSTGQSASNTSKVCVLPFQNRSADPEREYFSDGLADELISRLTGLEGLRVVARTSAFSFKGRGDDIREIGRKLDVDTVVEGSVRWSAQRLIVVAQAVDVRSGFPIWSQSFDRNLDDVFEIQREIAIAIAEKLKGAVRINEGQRMRREVTCEIKAYELYLKGMFHLSKMDPNHFAKALRFQQQAIEIDPTFQAAHFQIAEAYCRIAEWGIEPPTNVYPKAIDAVEQALRLDDESASAHACLGSIHTHYTWDWQQAERELRRAVELNSNLAMAHDRLAEYLRYTGKYDEAIEEAFLARDLDPLALASNWTLSATLLMCGRAEQAASQAMTTVEMFPQAGLAYFLLALVLEAVGENQLAIEKAWKAIEISGPIPDFLCILGFLSAKVGQDEQASHCLSELQRLTHTQYVMPFAFAAIHAGRQDAEPMFEHLEQSLHDRNWQLVLLNSSPWFEFAAGDSRFERLRKRIGLPTKVVS
jgi:serine/threonine-protein kinase